MTLDTTSGRRARARDSMDGMSHRHYRPFATGDGATVEFPLPVSIKRLDDLVVHVAGVIKRPADKATAHDYKVRGLSLGYAGDSNMVKFAAAPGAGANVGFDIAGG